MLTISRHKDGVLHKSLRFLAGSSEGIISIHTSKFVQVAITGRGLARGVTQLPVTSFQLQDLYKGYQTISEMCTV